MAKTNFTTPHSRAVAELADQGWQVSGFASFVFMFQFTRRIIANAPRPLGPEPVARRLFSEYQRRKLVNSKWRLAPAVRQIAHDSGRPMTTDQVLARLRRYQTPVRAIRRLPDAWRLSDALGVTLEAAEVSDTHPVFRDRLHDYSLFNDALPEAGIDGIRLFEVSANSGAIAEHDLPAVLVDACCAAA